MSYSGNINLGDTIDIKFNTVDYFGSPITLAGTPAVSAYPDNSTTELTAGITLTVDFDSRTGLHNVRVVATSGNGYAAGSNYTLVITAGTVDSGSVVGYIVASFSINARVTNAVAINGSTAAAADLAKEKAANPRGTVTTGATTTSFPTSALTINGSAASGVVADQFKNRAVLFDGDTTTAGLRGVSVAISANTASNTPTLTVDTLPATPASGDTFSVIAAAVSAAAGGGLDAAGVRSAIGMASANMDTQLASLLADADYTAPDNAGIAAIKTQTDKMAFTVANQIDCNVIDWKSSAAPAMTGDAYARLGAAGAGLTALGDTRIANLDATVSSRLASASYTAPPSAASISDAVWNEAIADHLTALTTGASLNAAGSAGDPWSTPLPGAYGDGTAGKIVGTNLDAQVSTAGGGLDAVALRAAMGLASANLDTQLTPIAAIQAKTDNLPASPAAVSDIPTAIQNADALLNRDMSVGVDSGSATVRTPRQALRFPRNKFTMAGNTLTVLKEDDATVSWSSTLTTDVNAEPIVGSDPAGP